MMDSQDKVLPEFDRLPPFHDFTGCAWGLWGPEDQLGTINLLTEKVVARAAQEEIKCVCLCQNSFRYIINDVQPRLGKTVSLNW